MTRDEYITMMGLVEEAVRVAGGKAFRRSEQGKEKPGAAHARAVLREAVHYVEDVRVSPRFGEKKRLSRWVAKEWGGRKGECF